MFYALVLIAAASRLLPHPPNLVCIGALGLFAGCYLRGRSSWLLPIGAMFVSDVIGHVFGIAGMGFYSPITMCLVYAAFGGTTWIGRTLRQKRSIARIGCAAVASSVLFFIVSNFGVWLAGRYDVSFAGLVQCYTMALPFFTNTLIGDLLYSAVLFGAYEAMRLGFSIHSGRWSTVGGELQPAPVRKV